MKYRVFPQNHEIKVSEVGFGVWSVATKWWGVTDESFGISLLRYGLDNGINFFDTADVYGKVMAKKLLIKLLTDLAMKVYWQLNLATISIQILPKERDIKSSLKNSQRKI